MPERDLKFYTASEIGQSIGQSRFAVRRALAGAKSSARVIRAGNEADVWKLADMPPGLRAAFARGPLKAWQSPVLLAELHQDCIEYATKLRAAFALTFANRFQNETVSGAELAANGVEDYRRAFGHPISPRHWQRLLERITARDGGAENWTRLEIYLPDETRLRRKLAAPREVTDDFGAVAGTFNSWGDPHKPTDSEERALFVAAFEWLESAIADGCQETEAKRKLITWLQKHAGLSTCEATLRRVFNLKLKAWRDQGSVGLSDRRKAANQVRRVPKLSPDDLGRLAIFAVTKHNGSLFPAWQQEWARLSDEIRARYPLTHEVPASIRRQVMPEIRRLRPQHIGPRAARLNGPYITRSWNNLFAGDVDCMDDHTLDIYTYREETPHELFRPQILLQVDIRSGYILNFALEFDKSWTAITALGLIRRKSEQIGQPRLGHYWERGKFKDAKILGKGGVSNIFTGERENFASRLGIEIRHALPGNARAKIVEREIGILAARMAGEPGYIGRDEMHVKYEAVQRAAQDVRARRVHPREAGFLSTKELEARLHVIVDEINNTMRENPVRYPKPMTPAEAWEKLQRRNAAGDVDPLVKLPAELEYLLSAYIDIVPITRHGISLFNGKHRYYGDATGAHQGERVKIYFDPERPEAIAITDLDGNNVRTVPLLPTPNVWAGGEDLKTASAAVSAHNRAQRRRYSDLKHKFFPPVRTVHVAIETLEKGREMKRQRVELVERSRAATAQEISDKQEITMRTCAAVADWKNRNPQPSDDMESREWREWSRSFLDFNENAETQIREEIENRRAAASPECVGEIKSLIAQTERIQFEMANE